MTTTTIDFVDTTLRDGNQSLWGATGLTTGMMLAVAPELDRVGYRAIDFSTSTHMAVTVRYHREDPWERLRLVKRIPAGAGLGGGSSDAAAVLVACNTLFETGLEAAELEKMAAPLGADVPFFVRGGTALGRGIGTLLTPLPTVRSGQFLIVKSGLHLQTQDVYGELKMGLTVHSPKANIGVIRPLLARFPQRNWPGFNRLEEVVLPSQPAVQRLVHRLRELAPVALLCGSGAAAFGAFGAGRDMTEIVEEFRQAGLWVRLVGPHPAGVVPGKG